MGDGKENKGGERDRDEEWVDGDGEMLLDGKGDIEKGVVMGIGMGTGIGNFPMAQTLNFYNIIGYSLHPN